MDVINCKHAVAYLEENGHKESQLLRKKWSVFKEIVNILQIPSKATIALQKHDLTLSDSYGIWLQMKAHLQSSAVKQICKTDFSSRFIDALDRRKEVIFNNRAMLAAIYLDPRYRWNILHDENLVEQAKQMLLNLWRRLVRLRPEQANNSITNCSNESSGMLNIDFNNPQVLNEYLSHNSTDQDMQQHCDIELEIELFQPEKLPCDASIISYWQSMKEKNKDLYKLAMVIYGIPGSETQIERDFSLLEFIFNQRRYCLSPDMIEAILCINLNPEIFYQIKNEKLSKSIECN